LKEGCASKYVDVRKEIDVVEKVLMLKEGY
jgi:hypothetical protein